MPTAAERAFAKNPDAILLLVTKGDNHPYKDYINTIGGVVSYKSQNKRRTFDPLLDVSNNCPPTYLVHHYKNEYNWVGKCFGQKLSDRATSPDGISVCTFRIRRNTKNDFPKVQLSKEISDELQDTKTKWRVIHTFLAENNLQLISGHISHGIMLVKKK